MNKEFKQITDGNEVRYVLEDGGSTTTGAVATVEKPLGELQRRAEPPKPRNFVAKNAKMGGAGQHKDKKKAEKQGSVKHKKPFMEGFNGEYDDEAGMAQSNLLSTARAVMGLLKTIKDRDNLPEWGQEKIAKAEMMLVSVWDYLQSQKAMGNDPQQGVAEGLIKDVEAKIKAHDQRKADREQEGDPYVAHELHSHNVIRKQLLDKRKRAQAEYHKRMDQQGVAEGSGESYIIVRTDSEGKKDVFAGNFDTYERAQKELDDCLAHPLHTKYKQKFEIKRKGQQGVAEAEKKGLYYYVNKRKKAGTSRDASSPKAPSAQAWKDAAKTAKKESMAGDDGISKGDETKFHSKLDRLVHNTFGKRKSEQGVAEDPYFNMLERSVSQAQHNLMVGVANNPQFAQKVKVKQQVGQEFAQADQGHDISALPIRVPKKK